MLDLHLKANPKEILVGWYATSPEFDTFSALIQNHYSGQGDGTFPHPAVHLTFKIEPGSDIDIKSYVSAPIGTTAERANDSALFIPIPYKLRQDPIDRAALELLGSAKDREDRTTYVNTDVEGLEKSITQTLELLDRVEGYVGAVVEEQVKPNQVLGEFLQNTVVMIPKVDPAEMERSL